jgi:nitrogen regulatory protein PII
LSAAGVTGHWLRGQIISGCLPFPSPFGNRVVKQIVAIVKPYLAEKILESLKRAPVEALTVREVKGYGRQKSYLDEYSDTEYSLAFLPKVEIELWADDSRVEEIVRKIVEIGRTGRMGDGKIFVLPVTGFTNIVDAES